MTREQITRRDFVARTAAAGLALGATKMVAQDKPRGANERLRIGIIGCGGRGGGLMSEIQKFGKDLNAEITAVCDTYRPNLNSAATKVEKWFGRKPFTTTNYEELLAQKDVDAVTVATPDFAHGPQLIAAMRAGKDVYVEKPMCSRLEEANEALRLAKETKRIVQAGTQRRSDGRHMAAAELIRSGALGTLSKVTMAMCVNAPRWRRDFSKIKEADVDWKRFLMHLPDRPFNASQFLQWHLYKDFTLGLPGLWMSHFIDLIPWFTGDPFPKSVVSHGGVYVWHDREHADTFQTLLEYPKGFLVSWEMRLGNSAGVCCLFYGTNGTLDAEKWKLSGEGGAGDKKIKEETVIKPQPTTHHMQNWLECVRSRQAPRADINAGYQHSIAGIMSAQALWSGRRQVFDPKTQTIRDG